MYFSGLNAIAKLIINRYINKYLGILILFSLLLSACNNSQSSNQNTTYTTPVNTSPVVDNRPRVVATTSVICSLTEQIAGDTIALDCLIPPKQNPRSYKMTDSDRQRMKLAQLILWHGYNLEPSMREYIRNPKSSLDQAIPKIAIAELAQPKPRLLKTGDREVSDPFIWHDARNTIKMADVIRNHLQKLAPKNAQIYTRNHQKLVAELKGLHTWIQGRINSIPSYNRVFISTYPELGYYANTYGLKSSNYIQSIRVNTKLSVTQLESLAKNLKKTRVPTIFAESSLNPTIFNTISQKAQVRVFDGKIYTYGLGEAGSSGETYQKMMTSNTRIIVEGLGGTYLIFEPLKKQ